MPGTRFRGPQSIAPNRKGQDIRPAGSGVLAGVPGAVQGPGEAVAVGQSGPAGGGGLPQETKK